MKQRHRKTRWQQRIIFFCILICNAKASAQDSASSGGYFGLKVGTTEHKHSCAAAAISCDRTGAGYGIFAGYDFDSRYALEFSVADIGESSAKYADVTLDAALSAADLTIKYSRRLYGSSRWFAKLGVAYWQGEVEGWDVKLDDSGFRPTFGLGSELQFSERFSARLEYQYLSDLGNKEMGHTDPHFLNLGITWHLAARKRDVEAPAPASAQPTQLSSHDSRPSRLEVLPMPEGSNQAATANDGDAESKPAVVINDQIPRPLFKGDSAVLQDTRVLEPVAIQLVLSPRLLVRIVVHTDDIGSGEYKQHLSQLRAEAVAEYLRWQGVAPERITTEGRGEDRPIAKNSDPAGRALNRRVEFFFTDTQIRRKSEGVGD